MAQSAFLQSFLKETPPKNIRMFAARGLAPIPPEEMLPLLVRLLEDSDREVSEQAGKTLADWPENEILSQIQSNQCRPEVLRHFASQGASQAILEAVILNPTTPGEPIEDLAARVPASLLETILYNRVRLLQFPKIVSGVKSNPEITPQIQVLVEQIEQEFFGAKKSEYAVAEPEAEEAESEGEEDLEFELPPEDLSLEGLPLDPEQREAALIKRIAGMAVPQKIRLALLGPREARSILIRDHNKEVAKSVLRSPKLSESEVEAYSCMRNISDEVLRQIGNTKEWARSYAIALNLVRNPKTPPMISQRMIFRLRNRELNLIVRDRGIPEAVRRNAQRTLSQRTSQQQIR